MKTAVVVFPGTNCEHDVMWALKVLGAEAELVWHRETDLSEFDGVILPGGFAHGDHLRTGAIARFSPVMDEVIRMAKEGKPVLGICNGFQILCEAGLLPGALLQNRDLKFICKPIHVAITSTDSILTRAGEVGQILSIPLNSYEGNNQAQEDVSDRVVAVYCDENGMVDESTNPNGSQANAAAVTNTAGNVAGIMPHPERAIEAILGSSDGQIFLKSFLESLGVVHV